MVVAQRFGVIVSKVALVTGSSRGLGLATAWALGRAGNTVIISGRDGGRIESLAADLREEGLRAESLVLDVESFESARCAAHELANRHDRLDVLVNNAGVLPEATQPAEINFSHPSAAAKTFSVNTLGVLNVVEAMLPLIWRSAGGRIVNVSSTMGSLADQKDVQSQYYSMVVPAYQASKAAVNSITIGLAKMLAGTTVKVTSVCPGHVQTDLAPGNRTQAPLTAEEAAAVVLRAATLPDDAESGTFIDAAGPVRW
ncbi:NADP-dependent 3-hydroxy acid dehydrogenase YdfG [Williamsia muralis]|uniref:NADP-dependent 3-hydroxy acid dehydrogenase YdfG n=1 Tax=Williamsia marianensis TaxID=85044 RepID=A0A495K7L2_WILMA|nr:NADP-dependent 3-hydroxy acid dehydrogenase YdfG [Williamsia muralis]